MSWLRWSSFPAASSSDAPSSCSSAKATYSEGLDFRDEDGFLKPALPMVVRLDLVCGLLELLAQFLANWVDLAGVGSLGGGGG